MKNPLGILIFDMDGTLVDSMEQHAAAFSQILHEEYGIPLAAGKRIYLSTAGEPLDRQFILAVKLHAGFQIASVDSLIGRFWSLIQESDPVLFPDVFDSIKQLSEAGYILAVTSGCTTEVVVTKMTKSGIAQYFNLMLGTDYNKPDIRKGEGHFRLIRNSLHMAQGDFCLNSALVGDSVHDMHIAKEAGILAIGRANNNSNVDELMNAGADFVIHTLYELLSLLREQNPVSGSSHFIPLSSLRAR